MHHSDNVPQLQGPQELGVSSANRIGLSSAKYVGGPGAQWINEGRGLWTLTEGGADKIVQAAFGKIYRSTSDGLWWSVDNAGYGQSAFKVFKETGKGLEWFRDADQFGDFIVGKHKGPTGMFIPWSQTSGVK